MGSNLAKVKVRLQKAGCSHAFMPHPTIWMLQQKSRLISPGKNLLTLYCPFCWACANCTVFRDALVHKLVGMCFYFSSFVCLSAQSSLAIHFSTVSTFLPTDVLFTGYFLSPWRRLCGKIPIDSNIHKPACHTQSDLKSPLFPILMNKKGYLEHVYMPKCTKYLPCDWLIRYFH